MRRNSSAKEKRDAKLKTGALSTMAVDGRQRLHTHRTVGTRATSQYVSVQKCAVHRYVSYVYVNMAIGRIYSDDIGSSDQDISLQQVYHVNELLDY
jgi:hypothetical protein